MSIHKQKLDWCLAKESRMKKIQPNDKLSKEHIEKAKLTSVYDHPKCDWSGFIKRLKE